MWGGSVFTKIKMTNEVASRKEQKRECVLMALSSRGQKQEIVYRVAKTHRIP